MTDTFVSFNELSLSLEREDERGLVLAIAAFPEDSLGELLAAALLDNRASRALLDGFNAPLGTLSARLNACSAFGLIEDEQFEDFERLRKIRNAFSHTWKAVKLDESPCREWVDSIHYNSGVDIFPADRRTKVKVCLSFRLAEVRSLCAAAINKPKVKPTGKRLVAGFSVGRTALEQALEEFDFLNSRLSEAAGEERRWLEFRIRNLVHRITVSLYDAKGGERDRLIEFQKRVAAAAAEIAQ